MNIAKHLGIMFVASFLAVLLLKPLNYLLAGIAQIYMFVYQVFARLITLNVLGYDVRQLLTLIIFPLLLALIPAAIYSLIKKRPMPHYMLVTWFAWTVLVVTLALR